MKFKLSKILKLKAVAVAEKALQNQNKKKIYKLREQNQSQTNND